MKAKGHSSPTVSLDTGLTVLAQFESKRVALAPADVERLAGVGSVTAARCLTMLTGLGYLASGRDGRYRLASVPADIRVRRGRGGSATGAATVSPRRGHQETGQDHPAREGGRASDGRVSLSVIYGLSFLQLYSAERQSIGVVAEMDDFLGLSSSSWHRYAGTFTELGYLQRDRKRRYMLAPGAANVGIVAIRQIRRQIPAEAILTQLRSEVGYTVGMGALDGARVTYIHRLHAHRRGQYQIDRELRSGAHVPVHCTALGKVLLASLTDTERRERIAASDLTEHTERTITDPDTLLSELAGVNIDAPLVSDEEFTRGARSIAMFVPRSSGGLQIAIDVTIPALHLTTVQLSQQLGPIITRAASAISDAGPEAETQPLSL